MSRRHIPLSCLVTLSVLRRALLLAMSTGAAFFLFMPGDRVFHWPWESSLRLQFAAVVIVAFAVSVATGALTRREILRRRFYPEDLKNLPEEMAGKIIPMKKKIKEPPPMDSAKDEPLPR